MLIVVGLIIAMIGAELVLRRFWPLADPYADDKLVSRPTSLYVPRGYPPNYVAEIRAPGVPGVPPSGRLTANSLGMRTPEFKRQRAPTERRVVVLGGSAIECRYLDDALTVCAVLQHALLDRGDPHTEVIFAGAWAGRSYDHLASLAHRVLHLQPDLIILPSGLGDMFDTIGRVDYLMPPPNPLANQRSASRQAIQLATELQLGRRIHRLARPNTASACGRIDISARSAEGWLYRGAPAPEQRGRMVLDFTPFRENLVSAVGIATAHRRQIVLCTQPNRFMSLRPELGPEPWCWVAGKAYTRAEIADAARLCNDVVRSVSREYAVPLCDLAAIFDGDAECFYDDFHYTPAGAAATARVLASFLSADAATQCPSSPEAMYSPRHLYVRSDG